jgi:hypothetical protein
MPLPKRGLRYRRRANAEASFPAATIVALALVLGSFAFAEWFRAEEVAEAMAEADAAPERGLGSIPVFGSCTAVSGQTSPADLRLRSRVGEELLLGHRPVLLRASSRKPLAGSRLRAGAGRRVDRVRPIAPQDCVPSCC